LTLKALANLIVGVLFVGKTSYASSSSWILRHAPQDRRVPILEIQ